METHVRSSTFVTMWISLFVCVMLSISLCGFGLSEICDCGIPYIYSRVSIPTSLVMISNGESGFYHAKHSTCIVYLNYIMRGSRNYIWEGVHA